MARIFASRERAAALTALRHNLFPDSAPRVKVGSSGTRTADEPPDTIISSADNADGTTLTFVGLNSGSLRLMVGDEVVCDRDNGIRQFEWRDIEVPPGKSAVVVGEGDFEIGLAPDPEGN